MILIVVGTHHQPFDRLIRAAEAWAVRSGERVVVQRGVSRTSAPHCEVVDWLPPTRLEALAREARVVVAHAGPGAIFLALDADRPLVVVPRDPRLGEHVDDHQQAFARHLDRRVSVVWDTTALPKALESASRSHRDPGAALSGQARSDAFAHRLESVIDDLLVARRPSALRHLLRWARGRR